MDLSRLGQVLSVREVAKKAGWPYQRMLRHLKRSDIELQGTLLQKQGKGKHTRYSVTLGALEQLHPQWFAQVSGHGNSIDEHDLKLRELEAMVERAHEDIGELRRRLDRIEGARRPRAILFGAGDF